MLVQVTKDPIGHKGARLTSHIALSGRHLVYVPNGNASGISRKLPDIERKRLRDVLKKLVPDGAGVIVRTAAEGASEDELARDVKRLQAQWEDIQAKAAEGNAPGAALRGARPGHPGRPGPVQRGLPRAGHPGRRRRTSEVEATSTHVSPDLRRPACAGTPAPTDVFAEWRIDEQILKGLDRKVFLPSGGHLVIDRTEAMTVVDVNTGKYTGAGGNLEETVTRNNLEAAEEIVRQLRLRDLGGIVVIDFIDMVLESNRELVLRRLTECLGRDRTKHQVTEITSLGLVQMTRKRIGAGPARGVQRDLRPLQGPRPDHPHRAGAGGSVATCAEKVKGGRRGVPSGRRRRADGIESAEGADDIELPQAERPARTWPVDDGRPTEAESPTAASAGPPGQLPPPHPSLSMPDGYLALDPRAVPGATRTTRDYAASRT